MRKHSAAVVVKSAICECGGGSIADRGRVCVTSGAEVTVGGSKICHVVMHVRFVDGDLIVICILKEVGSATHAF